MISVYLECQPAESESLVAELHERGTLGVLELGSGLRAWFDDDVDVHDLVTRYDGHVVEETDSDQDWIERTRDSFPPIEIGERFWLVPPWQQDPPPVGRMRLEINPGQVCGTGWHPCTQMCLEALERYLKRGDAVLDVGVGSGILSVAAELLGAGKVSGCDVDQDAVRHAKERIGGRVFVGSVDAVRAGYFDVLVANISAPVVEAMLDEFRRVAPLMILSGFSTIAPVAGTMERLERDGWQCLVVRR